MSTTRSSAYIIAAQLSLLFSGAVINFGLGRILGPGLYGQLGVVYAVATIINLLITPGVMQAVSKFCASDRGTASFVAGSFLRSQLFMSIAVAVLYYFLAFPVALLLRDATLADLLRLLTPLVVIYGLSSVYAGYVTGIGRFGVQAAELAIYSTSRLALTFVLVYFFSISGAIAALPVAAFLALVYLFFSAKLSFSSFPVGRVYRFAFPITVFVTIVAVFLSIDLFLIKILLQDNELVGFYTAASAIARIPYFVLSSLGMVLLPIVAGKLASKSDVPGFVKGAFRHVLILLLPSASLLFATATPLVMLLYRSEYAAAGLPLSILAVGTAFLTFAYLFAVILNAAGKPLFSAAASVGMLALSVALNVVLIPAYGLAGAAVSTTIASFVAMLVLFFLVYRYVGLPLDFFSAFRVAVASAIMFFLASSIDLSNKFVLPAAYAFFAAVYVASLFVLREVRKEDIRRIRDLLPERINAIIP